jgi:hypothetical protein
MHLALLRLALGVDDPDIVLALLVQDRPLRQHDRIRIRLL